MNKEEIIQKIIEKKEFNDLPKKDVEKIFSLCDRKDLLDEEKIKITRNLLRRVYSAFTSEKIFKLRDKSEEWIMNKHLSTKERLDFYPKIYKKIFEGFDKKVCVVDLGAGINGLSYKFMTQYVKRYIGVEALGQLVLMVNEYFKGNKIKGKMFHESLFNLGKIKEIIDREEEEKVLFLFKVADCLEMVERDYTKKLVLEIMPFFKRGVLSYATKSLVKQKKFYSKRIWLKEFLEENYQIINEFEFGGEEYILIENKK